MKRWILIFILLLSSVQAGLWQSDWTDASENLWRFRRPILIQHSEELSSEGPAEIFLQFTSPFPYCNDFNANGNLHDAEDSLAMKVVRRWENNSMEDLSFSAIMSEPSCISNQLKNVTLRFEANFTSASDDFGFGSGNSLYFIYHENEDYPSESVSTIGPQTVDAEFSTGAEERLWQDEWHDWNNIEFPYRARIHIENENRWRFNEKISAEFNFHRNLYCYDVTGDGSVGESDLLSLRVVRQYEDRFAETSFNFSGSCDENTRFANLSFVSQIPEDPDCENSFFAYYKPTGLLYPIFPEVSANSSTQAIRGKEIRKDGVGYCGNMICEDNEDICSCPTDCCPIYRTGDCFELCRPHDPDCCKDCWSLRYLCDGGKGQDCYPGFCHEEECRMECDANNECSSGICFNLTEQKLCQTEFAPSGTVLSYEAGKLCKGDFDEETSSCSDLCFNIDDVGYYEYDGSLLEIEFTLSNDCSIPLKGELELFGPLSPYGSLFSPHHSWDGRGVELTPGASTLVFAELENIPNDLIGIYNLKLSFSYGNSSAGSSPRVVVLPNIAYSIGRTVPPFVETGRSVFISTLNKIPVRMEVTLW